MQCFDLSAFVFPGQGPHDLGMVPVMREFLSRGLFCEEYDIVCEALGGDPIDRCCKDGLDYLNRNEVSSILTVLISVGRLNKYREGQGASPRCVLGYSVGQWTALYAAGVIGFKALVFLLKYRAELMNDCFRKVSGKMLSVIGVSDVDVSNVIEGIVADGGYVAISNYNSVGQYTVSGENGAVELFVSRIKEFNPKKMVMLPVRGAWHTKMLLGTEKPFLDYLNEIPLSKQKIPIVDNVSGIFLPEDPRLLRSKMVEHITHPVLWDKCIKYAIGKGCSSFVEFGYGNMLTRMGMYIDRKVDHDVYEDEAGV